MLLSSMLKTTLSFERDTGAQWAGCCVYWIMVIGLGLVGHGLRLLDYFFIMFVFLVDEYVADFGLPCICRKQCEEVGNMQSSMIFVINITSQSKYPARVANSEDDVKKIF